jgi:hypothetical protein
MRLDRWELKTKARWWTLISRLDIMLTTSIKTFAPFKPSPHGHRSRGVKSGSWPSSLRLSASSRIVSARASRCKRTHETEITPIFNKLGMAYLPITSVWGNSRTPSVGEACGEPGLGEKCGASQLRKRGAQGCGGSGVNEGSCWRTRNPSSGFGKRRSNLESEKAKRSKSERQLLSIL